MMVAFVPPFGNPALPKDATQTLYASEHLEIICHNPQAEKAVVVFDHRRIRDGDFAKIKRSGKITSAGFSYITVACRRNDWFLSPSLIDCQNKLSDFSSRYSRIVGFGSSMGGYGALALSRAFRFNQVLLVSPQITVFPNQPPYDQRFSAFAKDLDPAFDTLTQNPRKGLGGVILFDPNQAQDHAHARLICETFPRMRTVAMPFSGHPALQLVTKANSFNRIQDELIAPRISPYRLTQIHRAAREASPEYIAARDTYLKARASRNEGLVQ